MDSRRERLASARLYFVTDVRPRLEELLAAALAGGVDMVQLRDKEAGDDVLVAQPPEHGGCATSTARCSG